MKCDRRALYSSFDNNNITLATIKRGWDVIHNGTKSLASFQAVPTCRNQPKSNPAKTKPPKYVVQILSINCTTPSIRVQLLAIMIRFSLPCPQSISLLQSGFLVVVGSEIDVANSHFGVHLALFLGTRKKRLGTRHNILATSAFTILGLLSRQGSSVMFGWIRCWHWPLKSYVHWLILGIWQKRTAK